MFALAALLPAAAWTQIDTSGLDDSFAQQQRSDAATPQQGLAARK